METAPNATEFQRWHRLSAADRGRLARLVVETVSQAIDPFRAEPPTEAVMAQIEDAAFEAVQEIHRRFRELPPVEVGVTRGTGGAPIVGLSQWLIEAAAQGGEKRGRG